MQKITLKDPITHSTDVLAENVEQLRNLFPEAFTEGGVDFEVLKQLLGGIVDEGEEKYGLNWHGKRRARQLALTPSTGTLRPCPEESVDWDTTQNLMIEGDNLEVLKLLQKSYSGKIKLIYIDPPYNTGKDFVYPDDFRDSIQNYLALTGQREGETGKTSSNTETSGRFHTAWLNMMYPRLKLARTLLKSDGVIFMSIDDNEVASLQKLSDEIFGEENYVGTFIWEKRATRENRKAVSTRHDYILCYSRDVSSANRVLELLPMNEEAISRYRNPDDDPRGVWTSVPAIAQAGHGTRAQFYQLTTPAGRAIEPPSGSCWRYTEAKMTESIADGRIWFGADGLGVPRIKKFLNEGQQGLTVESMWWGKDVGTNDSAKRELTKLFDGKAVFETPKPAGLVERMVQLATDQDSIVLDFFAGSGPTGQAVIDANVADGGHRRYILTQLPEVCSEQTEASKAGYSTIADVCKERMRRSSRLVTEKGSLFSGDLGFRVFKLDRSNIRAWDPNPEDFENALYDGVEHLQVSRTEQDVLYELLLKLGLDLCVPIEDRTIIDKPVHSVGAGALLVCLATEIAANESEELAIGMAAWREEQNPAGDTTVVFRDSAFTDDVAKLNIAAILEQHGLENVRSL